MLFGFALYNGIRSTEAIYGQIQPTLSEPVYAPAYSSLEPARAGATEATRKPLPTRPASLPSTGGAVPAGSQQNAEAQQTPASNPSPSPPPGYRLATPTLDPLTWKQWPVIPDVSAEMQEVYRQGLARGNDPHAFSILGDCQSLPEVFLGVFDEDPGMVDQLPGPWQETVAQFQGSFNRYSPTVKDGSTEGAVLWGLWNDNEEGWCQPGESPLDCELRVHRPSLVFIHVGTHWEARNRHYLNKIIDKILAHGAVPILVTKADNRELDERVNANYAALAAERGLPLWNFWASVQNLPNHGMEPGSDMYLSPAGLEIHRTGAVQVLDAVWRALR